MRTQILVLAGALTLTACGNSTQDTPPQSSQAGIAGPADPLQRALSTQLFAPLGSQLNTLPSQLSASQIITCADNTVSLRALDLIDALALDVSTSQTTLSAPQRAALATALQDLLLSVGGLVMSLTNSSHDCQLASATLPSSGDGTMSDMGQLPPDALAPLLQLLNTLANGTNGLDQNLLISQIGQLNAIQLALLQGQGGNQLPLVPAVIELVTVALTDVVALLSTQPDPAAYQAAITMLVGNLTASLQALPSGIIPAGTTPLLLAGSPIGLLTGPIATVNSIPVLGAPLADLLTALTSAP